MKIITLVLTPILSIYAIIVATKWKKANNTNRFFAILAILLAIVSGYIAYSEWKKEARLEKLETNYGDIQNSDVLTVPIFQIGENGAQFPANEKGEYVLDQLPLTFNSGPPLKLYMKNRKLYLSTTFRDVNGLVIATIRDNEWEKLSNSQDFDYNYDDNGFEVVTAGDRNVCFQIDIKNGVAHFQGYLVNQDGNGFCFINAINELHTEYNTMVIPINKAKYGKNFPPSNIHPLFKYPRARYINIRNN